VVEPENKKVSFMLKKSCWKKKMIGVATRTSTKSFAPARVAVVDDLMCRLGGNQKMKILIEFS
jgi:hypothetical protein